MTPPEPGRQVTDAAVTTGWQLGSARVLAALARMTRDLSLAEELAQDALVAAIESWPREGIPANPGAWLMTVAKRRAVDTFRRAERHRDRVARLGHDLEEADMTDPTQPGRPDRRRRTRDRGRRAPAAGAVGAVGDHAPSDPGAAEKSW